MESQSVAEEEQDESNKEYLFSANEGGVGGLMGDWLSFLSALEMVAMLMWFDRIEGNAKIKTSLFI